MPRVRRRQTKDDRQLSLPLGQPALRLLKGGAQAREQRLTSRDDVTRLLLRSAADLLLRRISPARANAIQKKVDRVLTLFDASAVNPSAAKLLRAELDSLERMARELAPQAHGGRR